MKSKRLLSAVVSVSLLASAVLAGCGGSKGSENTAQQGEMDKEQYLNVVLGAEPKSLDASKASDSYSSQVLNEVMEGLTRVEQENGKDVVKPAGAEKWEKNEKGTEWTFYLRDNKWSDGKPVTAKDYVYGITRTLEQKTGSPYAFLLYPIKNAEKFNKGKVKNEELGVKAVDDKTIKFTLESPCAYFLDLTYFKVMHPQRQDIIEKSGDRYGTEKDTMVFSGPFVISNWTHNNKVELTKNKEYWDSKSVKLEKVTMKIIAQEPSRMSELFNGSLDMGAVTHPDWVKKFNDTGKFDVIKGYDGATVYKFFNQKDKYFKNAKIRKAFILAEDREGQAKTLFRGLATPAYAWCPPQVQIEGEEFRNIVTNDPIKKLKEENKDPKALLVEGLKEIGADQDPAKMDLTILQSGTDARAKEFAEFEQQNFKRVLGVNPKVEYVEWPIFQKRTDENNYQLAGMGWTGDYNDPMTFFDMFTSSAGVVSTGWSNKKYDELINKAGSTVDKKTRVEAFKEAENILLYDEAVVSPSIYRMRQTYARKYAKNIMVPLFGTVEFKYAYTKGR
ncbi:peptide ABC transporter substrate-binding protein [Hathewaya histolytica]|uniref:Peptide ABC transporter substrate-binding protein n=1 Tax=Hathewaya histolytica TaxID=1498 RepID=A0A4U9RLL0_HATHI|nr:peptide ABC transporter substrate-binding protein [Hathewaya histolytica]VTQ93034.1 peptide ABC transporter substrate-binding protein [Hathewaya histolytica]